MMNKQGKGAYLFPTERLNFYDNPILLIKEEGNK